jgi:hypothetical protein
MSIEGGLLDIYMKDDSLQDLGGFSWSRWTLLGVLGSDRHRARVNRSASPQPFKR